MEETYPDIAKEAKSQNAEIHWGDETGVRSDCQHGRGYAPTFLPTVQSAIPTSI